MQLSRFQELTSLYMDDDLASAELDELEQLLRKDKALVREFCSQLAIWEKWSQEVNSDRSLDAFRAEFHNRLETEGKPIEFRQESAGRLIEKPRRPLILHLTWATAAGIVLLLGFGLLFTQKRPDLVEHKVLPDSQNSSIHIRGEAVCTCCILGETIKHELAIRYVDSKEKVCVITVVDVIEAPPPEYNDFCKRPVPILVKGELVLHQNRLMIASARLFIPEPNDS